MGQLKLVRATINDITIISQLAKIIWQQHYTSIITQNQIDYMLNRMYSNENLTEQMVQKNHHFFLIQLAETNLGFISVVEQEQNNWHINKFYINQMEASKGIGSKAFELLLEIIQAKKLSLTVNRQNYKSINFYFKNGFKIKEVADFDIGNNYVMNDFVMEWENKNK